jgi:glycosyltransferase involved in cell wall biosynthesis
LEVIKAHQKEIDFWESEKDTGIYSAMNKGAREATGDFLYFLNADDWLADKTTLETIVRVQTVRSYDVFYGNTIKKYSSFETMISRKFTRKNIMKGIIPPHQAFFINREYFWDLGGFDESLRSAGDLDLYCRIEQDRKKRIRFLDQTVAVVRSGGFSSQKDISSPEVVQVIKKYYGPLPAARVQALLAVERMIKKTLLRLGLRVVYQKLLKYKMREA